MIKMNELGQYIHEICNNIPDVIFQQIGSFALSIFGIGITLFTVIYSFIINKKDFMNEIEPKILNGNICPELKSRYIIAEKYVDRQKVINKHILNISLLSIVIYCFFILDLLLSNVFTKVLLIILVSILLIYMLTSFFIFLKSYFNAIK